MRGGDDVGLVGERDVGSGMDQGVVDAADVSGAVVNEGDVECVVAHGLSGEGSFGAWDASDAGIDTASHVDGASERFERGFHHVVRISSVEHFQVQVGGGVVGKSAQELFKQRVGEMVLGNRCWRTEVDEGASAEVDDCPGEGFIHRHISVPVPSDAFSVAERFCEGLSECDAGVLDSVVEIDLDIALGVDREVGEAVFREEVKHVVQKRDSGGDLGVARAVNLEREGDAGFGGVTLDFSGASHP